MDIKLNLPKEKFSYSQLRLWLEDKAAYRRRYYEKIEEAGSKYMMFGSEIAKGLESGTIKIAKLVQYPVQEEEIILPVEGVPFHGYIDQFNPAIFKFREIKTGIMKPNGLPRWTQRDVDNHKQLDIYSLLIQMKYGSVDDECHLDWLITRQKKKHIEFAGHVLEADSRDMELTGELISFRRVISQRERDRAKMLILSCAMEISQDYTAWLKKNGKAILTS